jgi:hypothetical protein
MRPVRRIVLLSAAMLLVAVACADSGDPALEGTAPPAASSAATAPPSVTIDRPADASTIQAGDVTVSVSPANFEIVNKLSQPAVAGEGHIHYYLDVAELPTEPGKPAVTTDAKTYHAAATTTYTWPDVPAGEHTLGVQLVNNDHTPLEPPVTEEVTVTVQ